MIPAVPPFLEQADLTCGCVTTGITPCALHFRADLMRTCIQHLLDHPDSPVVRLGAEELLRLTAHAP
jgi:hypothetical protein